MTLSDNLALARRYSIGVFILSFLKISLLNVQRFRSLCVMLFSCDNNECEKTDKFLTIANINQHIRFMEDRVRGPLHTRAARIEKDLEQGVKKPFNEITWANIGDCHGMEQKPITFIRQVLALVSLPSLFLNDPQFPEDAKERARTILKSCNGGSLGSYPAYAGIEVIRRHVAEFIQRRDGHPADWQNIIMMAGAADAVRENMLKVLNQDVNGKRPGIMVPIPQHPLYNNILDELNMKKIGYYLAENSNWSFDLVDAQRAVDEAKAKFTPRAIVVINPGNPTGQVLTRDNIEKIIKFAHKEKLFLFADEVYQLNVYAEGSKFYSFKKVLMEMGTPYSNMELASFMSCSKGYMGECGLRGGYTELFNVCPQVKAMLLKAMSASLYTNVLGQVAMDCVVNPPRKGEPSHPLFMKETVAVLSELKERAKVVVDTFNNIPGTKCNELQGAMYAFPRIELPPKAIAAAQIVGKTPDELYGLELLEATGICITPGSDFGQEDGTYHFRSTILLHTEKLMIMMNKLKEFHIQFLKKYS